MPIGELFDLEAIAQACAEQGRYTFFFTSWPLNVYVSRRSSVRLDADDIFRRLGGVASPPNAAVPHVLVVFCIASAK